MTDTPVSSLVRLSLDQLGDRISQLARAVRQEHCENCQRHFAQRLGEAEAELARRVDGDD